MDCKGMSFFTDAQICRYFCSVFIILLTVCSVYALSDCILWLKFGFLYLSVSVLSFCYVWHCAVTLNCSVLVCSYALF